MICWKAWWKSPACEDFIYFFKVWRSFLSLFYVPVARVPPTVPRRAQDTHSAEIHLNNLHFSVTIGAKPVGESAACFSITALPTLTIPEAVRHGDQSAMPNPAQGLLFWFGRRISWSQCCIVNPVHWRITVMNSTARHAESSVFGRLPSRLKETKTNKCENLRAPTKAVQTIYGVPRWSERLKLLRRKTSTTTTTKNKTAGAADFICAADAFSPSCKWRGYCLFIYFARWEDQDERKINFCRCIKTKAKLIKFMMWQWIKSLYSLCFLTLSK